MAPIPSHKRQCQLTGKIQTVLWWIIIPIQHIILKCCHTDDTQLCLSLEASNSQTQAVSVMPLKTKGSIFWPWGQNLAYSCGKSVSKGQSHGFGQDILHTTNCRGPTGIQIHRQYVCIALEKEEMFKYRIKTGAFDGLYFKELFWATHWWFIIEVLDEP